MPLKVHSYSNPIYEMIDDSQRSFSQPLVIQIEVDPHQDFSKIDQKPAFLLTTCHHSAPSSHHNYVNQRLDDEENLFPIYARPRKRCVTLEDDHFTIPAKASRQAFVSESFEY
jgi:hypothetical protein